MISPFKTPNPLLLAFSSYLLFPQTHSKPIPLKSEPDLLTRDYSYDSSGTTINTQAGASGSDAGAFDLGTGGVIAIFVAVILVVLIGIISITLYILAKRRNWQVRKTIARASRRVTGRARAPKPSSSSPSTFTSSNTTKPKQKEKKQKPLSDKARAAAARKAKRNGAIRLASPVRKNENPLEEDCARKDGGAVFKGEKVGVVGADRERGREREREIEEKRQMRAAPVGGAVVVGESERDRDRERKVGVIMPPEHWGR